MSRLALMAFSLPATVPISGSGRLLGTAPHDRLLPGPTVIPGAHSQPIPPAEMTMGRAALHSPRAVVSSGSTKSSSLSFGSTGMGRVVHLMLLGYFFRE